MKFKPFGSKYIHSKDVLVRDFPDFMKPAIAKWLFDTIQHDVIVHSDFDRYTGINQSFQHYLHIEFRELFPQEWSKFLTFTMSNSDRICNILALILQNYANSQNAKGLEYILSQGGSAYEVTKTDNNASAYDKGVYDLTERVSSLVKDQAKIAIDDNKLLAEAWHLCYSRNPDYEKSVTRACDFLEGFLGKKYFPKDTKPQLKKFVHAFIDNPTILKYKGDSLLDPKSNLTSLLIEASNLRGQHTEGKGRLPTKNEAEFILHTTIYIWNLHTR